MGSWQDKLNQLDALDGLTSDGTLGFYAEEDESSGPGGLGSFTIATGPETYPDEVKAGEDKLTEAIEALGIVEAYTRWCGKTTPSRRTGEAIMVSCPIPGHADRNPSAWLNADKNLWHCGACETGGDIIDLASYYYNYTGYKESGRTFHELRKAIGNELGFTFWPTVSGMEEPVPPGSEPRSVAPQPGTPTPHLQAVPLHPQQEDDDYFDFESTVSGRNYTVGPDLDMSELCPPGTFLESYFSACRIDDVPEEFHYINGLVALSMLAGRHVTIANDGRKYYPNLFVCLVAPSGSGKSLARGYLEDILESVFPFTPNTGDTEGVDILPPPNSGEVFIDMLRNVHDSPTGNAPMAEGDIRAYLDFDEISQLFSKMKAKGSMLREVVISVYDCKSEIRTRSRGMGGSTAQRPFCSLTTSVQPEAVRDIIENRDIAGGLVNRFLFMTGTPKRKRSLGQAEVDLALAERKLRQLREWLRSQRMAMGGTIGLSFTSDALQLWDEVFHNQLTPLVDGVTGTGEAGKRADFIAKKILMLYALNSQRTIIQREDVVTVSKLFQRLEHAWRYIAGQAARNVNTSMADVEDAVDAIKNYIGPQYRKNSSKVITFTILEKYFKEEEREFGPGVLDMAWKKMQSNGQLAEAQLMGKRSKGRPPKDPVVPTWVQPGPPEAGKGSWVASGGE